MPGNSDIMHRGIPFKVNIAPMGKFIPFLGSLHDIEHGYNLKNQKKLIWWK